MNNIEIEVKVLLQSEENAKNLLEKLEKTWKLEKIWENSQLNHYFDNGDFMSLKNNFKDVLNVGNYKKLEHILEVWKSFSVRTRKEDERVIFVIKASIDESNSINWTWRIEFEVDVDMDIDSLDKILLESGFPYGSKWSRSRKEYKYKNYTVAIDKNSWYWYLAEFERVVPDGKDLDLIKKEIREELAELSLIELSQDRVNRMYQYYIKNWPDYYGASEFKYFDVK